jgi:carbon-monoxide dehydrogenase medium subunit
MLLNLREYYRPAAEPGRPGLERALEWLARPGIHTVPLAGGDTLLGSADPTVEAVVDLQGLGLDAVEVEDGSPGRLRIGAMVTRSALAEAAPARALYNGVIAEGARRWGGSVQRNRATVGGAVATAAGNDALVAALLVCAAVVVLQGQAGAQEVPLADFLPRRGRLLAAPALITALIVAPLAPPAGAALATVARTPADAAIVLATAALALQDGRCRTARLAVGGVADTPIRLPEVEATLVGQAITAGLMAAAATRAEASVHPTGDFRGSASYRRAMTGVLAGRALREALARC